MKTIIVPWQIIWRCNLTNCALLQLQTSQSSNQGLIPPKPKLAVSHKLIFVAGNGNGLQLWQLRLLVCWMCSGNDDWITRRIVEHVAPKCSGTLCLSVQRQSCTHISPYPLLPIVDRLLHYEANMWLETHTVAQFVNYVPAPDIASLFSRHMNLQRVWTMLYG